MGMTFSTLHLWGIGREALLPRLEPGDLLREQNAPWLGVVPDEEACGDLQRLEKLGKILTKENGSAAALLFYYYDDDWFLCRLYQGGKKTAEGRGEGSWAKLGKKLNELFGDEAPAKALRYLSRCSDLQEQIALLEETVGAALYDVSVEEQPRRVPRSDTTLRAIKARESALRKRPNQFVLTELKREDWPEELRESWDMGELVQARYPYGLGFPVQGPYHPGALFGSPHIGYTSGNREGRQSRFMVYDSGIGQFREWGPFSLPPVRLLWKTKRGELVLLFHRLLTVSNGERSWVVVSGTGSVRCVLPDGSERWSFEPELGERNLTYAHSSQEGILTLYAVQETRNAISSAAQIWRMDGETGEILCSRKLPETERLKTLCYVPAMDAFLYVNGEKKELVLLDTALREIARWGGFRGHDQFQDLQIGGFFFWEQQYWDHRSLDLYDLRDGARRNIPLEIPAFVWTALSDGRILGTNEKGSALTVFDREGKVAARFSLPGTLCSIQAEAERVCLDVQKFEGPMGMEAGPYSVWRLDPVK